MSSLFLTFCMSEPVIVNLFKEPRNRFPACRAGYDNPIYLSHRPDRLHRLAESNPRNRFLVSLYVYKYGLWFTFKKSIVEKAHAFCCRLHWLYPTSSLSWYGRAFAGTQGEEIVREWLGMCQFLACLADGGMGGGCSRSQIRRCIVKSVALF